MVSIEIIDFKSEKGLKLPQKLRRFCANGEIYLTTNSKCTVCWRMVNIPLEITLMFLYYIINDSLTLLQIACEFNFRVFFGIRT